MKIHPNEYELITQLLNLNDIKIDDIKFNQCNEVIIRAQSTKTVTNCHRCAGLTEPYGKGRPLKLRHLPMFGKKIFIEITPPRGICHRCDHHPTTTQTLDWYDRNAHHTKFYEKHVLLSLVHCTIADISVKEDLDDGVVQHIIDKHISEKINWNNIKKLGLVGIDEIAIKKGYKDYAHLKSAIGILVNKQECYDKEEKKKLEKLFVYSPLLRAAYRYARQLIAIFNTHHKKPTAKIKIRKWVQKVEASHLKCFNKFIKTLDDYFEEITNYFIGRNMSGFAEGFNNKIKVIKRRCYGIYNLKHFFQRIFLDCEGYRLFKLN